MRRQSALAPILSDPETVVFLGAGASVGTGLPLGNAGAQTIVHSLFRTIGQTRRWRAMDRVCRKSAPDITWPRFEVVTGLLSQFDPPAAEAIVRSFLGVGLSATHQLLASLSSHARLWLTTNFDDQIERAVALAGRRCTVVNERLRMAGLTRRNLRGDIVVKLHGDAGSRAISSNLGVRIDQLLRPFDEDAQNALLRLAANRPILFVGYAVRDWDVRFLVTALVRRAPAVGWIGYGEAVEDVARFAAMPHVVYDGSGSPAAIERALRVPAPPSVQAEGTWEGRIDRWLRGRPVTRLIHAAAELLMERGDVAARLASVAIQGLLHHPSGEDRYWSLRREGELAMRAHPFDGERVRSLSTSLVRVASTRIRRRIRVQALLQAASMVRRTAGAARAARLLHRALRIARFDPAVRIDARSQLGYVDIFRGANRFAGGMANLRRAYEAARRLRDPLRIINTANNLSVGLMRSPGKAAESERVLRDSEPFLREINSPRSLMVWHVNLAEASRIERKFEEALELNTEALRLAKTFGDGEVEMNVTANLGLCHLVTGDVRSAEEVLTVASRLARRRSGGEVVGNTLLNRGWLRMLLLQWEDAIPWFRLAARSLESCGSTDRAASTSSLEAWCHFRNRDLTRARRVMRKVTERRLTPRGILAGEYRMTQFALRHANATDPQLLDLVERRFGDDCEQRAQLLLWIADEPAWSVDRAELTRAILAAVRETRIAPLAASAASKLGVTVENADRRLYSAMVRLLK